MPEQIENRMVVDNEWPAFKTVEDVLSEKGYHNIKNNEFVPEKEAFEYAIWNCVNGEPELKREFKKEFGETLVEWFFSGNWIKEE